MSNKTIDYYNQNADSFVQGTVSVDFKETQDKFLKLLTGKYLILVVDPEEIPNILLSLDLTL